MPVASSSPPSTAPPVAAGAGRELIAAAVQWARERGAAGVRAETQSNNVAACRFYARCGFVLAGFDRSLYVAIPGHGQETALFWYLPFPPADDRRLRRPPRPRTG